MAAASLIPKNGAVAYASLVWDFNSFNMEASQSVENVTPYDTVTESKNVGAGTPDYVFNITAFALAHSTNSVPNFSGTSTIFTGPGATCTVTLDTGVTQAFTGVLERATYSHARMRAAVPAQFRLKNGRSVTESWVTT